MVTSAVEGVVSSRRENTSTKGRLESLSVYVQGKHSLPKYFQVYVISQPYVYNNALMPKDQSMGAIWYKRKPIQKSREMKSSQTPDAQREHIGYGVTLN